MPTSLRSLLPLPPAVRALLLVNVGVFVLNALLLGRLSEPARGGWFAFSGPGLLDGFGLGALRVLSHQFTHAFTDPLHLVMNMVALWVFGPMAEARLGARGVLRLYLWGGVAGAAGHLLVTAAIGHPGVALVGASGACYALLLFAACAEPHARIVFVIVAMPLWGLAALLVGLGAYLTFVELATGGSGGVAHSAHLAGAATGWLAHRARWFGGPSGAGLLERLWSAVRERRARRQHADAAARELHLDAILAKVKLSGLAALDGAERRFLAQASQRARR